MHQLISILLWKLKRRTVSLELRRKQGKYSSSFCLCNPRECLGFMVATGIKIKELQGKLKTQRKSVGSGLPQAQPTPHPGIFQSNKDATETRTTTQASQAFSCCHGSFPLFLLLHLFFLQDAFHSCAKSNLARLASSRQKSLQPPNDSVVWVRLVLSHKTLVSA